MPISRKNGRAIWRRPAITSRSCWKPSVSLISIPVPGAQTLGRAIVAHLGQSLVKAMEMAKSAGKPEAAQLVAGECVVLAEAKDHLNWELIQTLSEKLGGKYKTVLKEAQEEVESQEDHHLYHTKGWTRELWIESLGLPAVLPPPEEVKQVETAIGAARAEQSRDALL